MPLLAAPFPAHPESGLESSLLPTRATRSLRAPFELPLSGRSTATGRSQSLSSAAAGGALGYSLANAACDAEVQLRWSPTGGNVACPFGLTCSFVVNTSSLYFSELYYYYYVTF